MQISMRLFFIGLITLASFFAQGSNEEDFHGLEERYYNSEQVDSKKLHQVKKEEVINQVKKQEESLIKRNKDYIEKRLEREKARQKAEEKKELEKEKKLEEEKNKLLLEKNDEPLVVKEPESRAEEKVDNPSSSSTLKRVGILGGAVVCVSIVYYNFFKE